MNILVTGTSGFVGSKLATELNRQGHTVLGADIKTPPIEPPYKSLIIDLADWNHIKTLDEDFDVIYHIAGHSAGDLSTRNYEEDLRSNTLSTANIIKLAQNSKTKQIIYASSMAVYGEQKKFPIAEDRTPNPLVYYGANKLASEYYLKIASSKKLHTTSLRLFNIYGPGQDVKNLKQGLVSIFVGELIKNKHLEMRGSPKRFRDFLYIDDTVKGLISCLGNKRINGEVINLASGKANTLGELTEIIRKNLPFKTSVSYSEPSSFDLYGMHGDITKAKRLLGFKAKVSLEEGIKEMIGWALGNRPE
jgi:UDP-glucose 4-epimerase